MAPTFKNGERVPTTVVSTRFPLGATVAAP